MPSARRRRAMTVSTAAATTAVVTATDWPLGVLSEFWRDHALLGGIVSGVVLLVIGSFIVESLLRWRDAARWARVGAVAAQSLAEGPRYHRAVLWFLVFGGDGPERGAPLPDDVVQGVPQVLERYGFEQASESAVRHGRPLPEPGWVERLHLLTADEAWCRHAREALRSVCSHHREVLAPWVPALASVDDGLEVLSATAALAERTSSLRMHAALRGAASPEESLEVVDLLQRSRLDAVALLEQLRAVSGHAHEYLGQSRRTLSDEDLAALDSRL